MFGRLGLTVLAFAFVFSMASSAGEVTKVKGRGVLLNLDGEDAQSGDMFFLLSDGKKKAIVKITKVKGDQALATILKGKASPGMTIQKREASSSKQSADYTSHSSSGKSGGLKKAYWGGLLGFSLDSMTADVPTATGSTTTTSTSMTGTSFSLLGMFDYKLFEHGWFRGQGGYQGYQVAGSSVCSGSTTCNMSASYIDLNFLFRYLFTDDNFRPWLGGGFGLMFPAMKSSSALDSGSISSTGIFIFSGGFDWSFSPTMYLPVSIEYGLFPKSSTVDASWITIRAGLAVPF